MLASREKGLGTVAGSNFHPDHRLLW